MKGRCDQESQLARKVRDLVRSILSHAREIRLSKASRDKYFRIDARVVTDGQDLSEILITQGLAVLMTAGQKSRIGVQTGRSRELWNSCGLSLRPSFKVHEYW